GVELLAGFADRQPSVNLEYRHPAGLAHADFHGRPLGHNNRSVLSLRCCGDSQSSRTALYAGGWMEQRKPFLGDSVGRLRPERAVRQLSEKRILGMKISNCEPLRGCV